jgi:hypothetical protein
MGFPHSEIFGSKCAGNSPKLIAACHVLHRLSVPRHPPNALIVLDLTFCQRNDDLAIAISARSVQGTIPTRRPFFTHSSRPAFERCGTVELLDFQTSSDKRCQRTNSAPDAALVFSVDGGGRRDRTDDLLLAKQALSQLSYAPV